MPGTTPDTTPQPHREEVLARDRERAAKRRARLNALKPGDDELEAARQRARESSARYRERVGGATAPATFDAPIPNREPESEPEDDDEQDLSWGPVCNNAVGPMICDYDDPFFKRC
ncbi:hypothetical protein B0H14DRAFT_3493625 [Mycena olivaceomarginata]|nr:hypothetical protein B0H14DRAFT_3493625 [Mycena olivaceomarginata]